MNVDKIEMEGVAMSQGGVESTVSVGMSHDE